MAFSCPTPWHWGWSCTTPLLTWASSCSLGGLSHLTMTAFTGALRETVFMGAIVFVVSNLWGNRIGAHFAQKRCDPAKDNPYFCQLLRQGGTVAIMCPSMSLFASILFQVIFGGAPLTDLPLIWVGTILKNFPMAFFWNFFASAPFCHWVLGLFFPQKTAAAPSPTES